MTNKEILQADVLDILFEHRNKKYGAYTLRKYYNNRLGLALAISLSLAMLFLLSSFIRKNNPGEKNPVRIQDSLVIKPYLIPQEPDEPKPEKKQTEKQVKSTDRIQIVPNDTPADMPEQNDIIDAVVGTETIAGLPLEDPNKIVKPGITQPAENAQGQNETVNDFKPKEIPASFPGGIEAWLRFLQKYLQTPGDLEPGQRVEVRVKFWIDTDGSVSRFEIVKSGGPVFDRELLRVMKKMPDWVPAIQNNRKVAVAFTQPVIFLGVEE